MAKPYMRLRGLMAANGDTGADIARELKLGQTTLSHRMMGHEPWRVDEMYALMDRYRMPHSELHLVFPPEGRNE